MSRRHSERVIVRAVLSFESGDEEVDRRRQIGTVDAFCRRVQISRRHRDRSGRSCAPGPLEAARVGPACREHFELIVDVSFLGYAPNPPVQFVVRDDARILQFDRRSVAESGHLFTRFEPGDVVRDRGVDREHEVGVQIDAERRRAPRRPTSS